MYSKLLSNQQCQQGQVMKKYFVRITCSMLICLGAPAAVYAQFGPLVRALFKAGRAEVPAAGRTLVGLGKQRLSKYFPMPPDKLGE
jgi:hypothetical protein